MRLLLCVYAVLLLTLGSPGSARAGGDGSANIDLGVMVNSTSISNNPATSEGFTSVAVPTFAIRQWVGHLDWGFDAEGAFAGMMEFIKIGHVSSDRYLLPFLGADVGYAVSLAGGHASLNFVMEGVAIKVVPTDSSSAWFDLGVEARYSHPISNRARINLVLEGAQTRGSNANGGVVSVRIDGSATLAQRFGVFAGLVYEHRSLPESSTPDGKFALNTVLLRFGLNVHVGS
jgi:hypothetical protein